MKFSIITPSFRNSDWLRLCVASVADQQGVALEHIVQDSCSDDGTQEWLPKDPRVQAFIEKDTGMYDAINRGLRRATGEIVAQLNCDEQYLPGALKAVEETFQKHPDADIVLGDSIVVDREGSLVTLRKSLVPWRLLMWTYIPTLTSSVFFRRRLLEEWNLYFDTRFRFFADNAWMREAIQLRLKMVVLRRYTSVFSDTGENMALRPAALREAAYKIRLSPWWARWFRWPLHQLHRVRAACHGLYWEKPFHYSLYTLKQPDRRSEFFAAKPSGIWRSRHEHARQMRGQT